MRGQRVANVKSTPLVLAWNAAEAARIWRKAWFLARHVGQPRSPIYQELCPDVLRSAPIPREIPLGSQEIPHVVGHRRYRARRQDHTRIVAAMGRRGDL